MSSTQTSQKRHAQRSAKLGALTRDSTKAWKLPMHKSVRSHFPCICWVFDISLMAALINLTVGSCQSASSLKSKSISVYESFIAHDLILDLNLKTRIAPIEVAALQLVGQRQVPTRNAPPRLLGAVAFCLGRRGLHMATLQIGIQVYRQRWQIIGVRSRWHIALQILILILQVCFRSKHS